LKGVRSGVERRRGVSGLKARDPGRRETIAKVLKDRRPPRRRGRMGTSVKENAPDLTTTTAAHHGGRRDGRGDGRTELAAAALDGGLERVEARARRRRGRLARRRRRRRGGGRCGSRRLVDGFLVHDVVVALWRGVPRRGGRVRRRVRHRAPAARCREARAASEGDARRRVRAPPRRDRGDEQN
jgi:hypothetical protein